MDTYLTLIRGINVGGKNMVSMAALKRCLEDEGFTDVLTYIASGNVIFKSDRQPFEIREHLEAALPRNFQFDKGQIKVLVLTYKQLHAVVTKRPQGFGDEPGVYYSDVIFLIGIDAAAAMAICSPKEGVDRIWPGEGVVYSQRLAALRTKSRLSKIVGTPEYKSMTIRSWNTVTKLLELMRKAHER